MTTTAAAHADRRRSARVACETDAWLEGLDMASSPVRLGDLSAEGAFVDAATVLPPGTIARLRFRLDDREIGVMTEVRYAVPAMGMGLHFLDLCAGDRSSILAFVSAARQHR